MKVGIVDAAFHADREQWEDWRWIGVGGRGADRAGVPDFKWQKDVMVLYRQRTPRAER
jgi:hypothetical protein